jgi:hypothetical protein
LFARWRWRPGASPISALNATGTASSSTSQARRGCLPTPSAACGARQLRDSQARQGAGLAGQPSAGAAALHPTYASWLNLVEVFFSIIQRQVLGRGDVGSVQELVAAIGRFCDGWNQRCQPFTWTKDADQILAKLNRQASSERPARPWAAAEDGLPGPPRTPHKPIARTRRRAARAR